MNTLRDVEEALDVRRDAGYYLRMGLVILFFLSLFLIPLYHLLH